MRLPSVLLLCSLGIMLSGCQIPYLVSSGYQQGRLLTQRKPIDRVLAREDLPVDLREKLLLVAEVKEFAREHIGFKSLKNYSSYVELNRPYVSYIVTASPKDKLIPHLWWFPIVGKVPYKGYFSLEGAQKEEVRLKKKNLDTYLRGVSAYSTLGWFRDPILSSMANMPAHNFVNVLFHELTHANLYLKSSVDFNERVATFLGDRATEDFYLAKEGPESATVRRLRDEREDTLSFSAFIAQEIETLQDWYDAHPNPEESERELKFVEIKQRFEEKIIPKLKTSLYSYFPKIKINNAFLQQNSIYYGDMDQYLRLHQSLGANLKSTFEFLKTLEKSKHPEEDLKARFEELPPS